MSEAIIIDDGIPSESEFKEAVKRVRGEYKRMKELIAQEEMLLIPSQAAAMIGISPQAMERKIKDGVIRSFVFLGKVWVSGKQIDEIMNDRIKTLVKAGIDKNQIEEGMFKKMFINAKVMMNRKPKRNC